MNKRLVFIVVIAVALTAGVLGFVQGRRAEAPSEQKSNGLVSSTDQNSSKQGDPTVEPDINAQEFKISGSNVNCSTSTVNGQTSSSCNGNIRVVPTAQDGMEPGLYKINEQTKLLKNGVSQDLNSLQQLAQANQVVRLKLAEGSTDTLAEINY